MVPFLIISAALVLQISLFNTLIWYARVTHLKHPKRNQTLSFFVRYPCGVTLLWCPAVRKKISHIIEARLTLHVTLLGVGFLGYSANTRSGCPLM